MVAPTWAAIKEKQTGRRFRAHLMPATGLRRAITNAHRAQGLRNGSLRDDQDGGCGDAWFSFERERVLLSRSSIG